MENYIQANSRQASVEAESNISEMPAVATIEASSPWKNAEVSFNYVQVDYPKLHTHTHWELFIILAGRVTHEINGHYYTLMKGDACLIRPEDCHRLFHGTATETGSYQHLNFLISTDYMLKNSALIDPALYENLVSSADILKFTVNDNLLSSTIKHTTIQAKNPPTSDNLRICKLIFQNLYLHFLNHFLGPDSTYPEWLLHFLARLQDVSSFSMPVIQLARTTPYSYSRLIRIFKSYTGVSLVDYMTDTKIRYAESLLKNTNMTMLAISSALDYSVSYFNKLFKKRLGLTPGDYRRKYKRF